MRFRDGITKFEWVKGHSGIEGNKEADKLAKNGSTKEELQGPPTFYTNTINSGAQLSSISQALIYRGLIENSPEPTEKKCTNSIHEIKEDLKTPHNTIPKINLLWLNLIKSKNVYRTQHEFIYKTIKGAQKIGEWWENIPQYEERAKCSTCGTTENMNHILTQCRVPGQMETWAAIEQIWKNRYQDWTKPSLGEILGCASIRFRKNNNNIDKGKSHLYQILISEAAHYIWTLRCNQVIKHDNN